MTRKHVLTKILCLLFLPFLLNAKILYAQFPVLLKHKEIKSVLHYELHGVKGKVRKNIQARLSVLIKSYQGNTSAKQYQAFVQQAPEQILKAMQPYAYYKPQIQASLLSPETPNMHAVFNIEQGPQLLVTKLTIVLEGPGRNEPFFQKVVKSFPLKEGEPLLIQKYNRGKQAFMDTATQEGYLKAEMTTSEILVNLDHYTSQITLRFNTGKRFYFGDVTFSKTPFNEDYLRRYIPFARGAPFSPNELTVLQDDLSSSEQFKQITVLPEYNDVQNQSVPVLVELTPAPSQSYTFGAGYGTDTGVRGTVGWNLLRVTPSGHKFQALIQASQLQDSIQAQYIIPGQHPTTEEYAITGSVYNLNYPGSQSNAAQLSGAYRTHVGDFNAVYSLNALYEHYTIEQDPSQNAFVLYPSANWKKRVADNAIFAKNGYSISFTTQGSAEALGSSVSFAQAEAVGKWAKTIRPLHSRIYTRADVGMTSVNDINNLPPSLQFYTGGAQSVRGYSYQSLGPGKALIAASAEWQQEVIKNGYLTFFYDAGNAFNGAVQLMRSRGAGIMWVTPIGPLHLSVAQVLDETPNNSSGSWHVVFSMGPDL